MRYRVLLLIEIAHTPILSGALAGKAAFMELLKKATSEPEEPAPLLLDFKGIDVATASFLREAVFALKSHLRTSNSKFYAAVANVNDTVREELSVVAESRSDALLAVETNKSGSVTKQTVIGSLDPKQASTFKRVSELQSTDAGSLMEKFGAAESTTSTTAWNNRLASLVAHGLIREYSRGRAKFYRPLFEEVR